MNNEPVAWMHKTATSWVSTFIHPETKFDEWIPLYTHPVKELSEDEIKEVVDSVCHDWDEARLGHLYMVEFARAIVRKAQEK